MHAESSFGIRSIDALNVCVAPESRSPATMLFRSRYHYLSLSPASKPPARFYGPRKNSRWIPKRPLRVVFLLMAVLIASVSAPYLIQLKLPPLYQSFRYREDNLSHYDADAPYPNGRHAKYIFFANHQRGVGWGNVMQELLLNALLAYKIKRSFVFYNYEWGTRTWYSLYNGHLIPSTIPLSAIVSGEYLPHFVEGIFVYSHRAACWRAYVSVECSPGRFREPLP